MSRLVAAGVYPSLKDVAASQCFCSRGADDGFISFFRKMFTHLFARSGRPAWEDRPSYHHLQQLKDQQSEEVACQNFLEGKKQRVVNIVTVSWLVTAGLRGGQILEASSSTCSASHSPPLCLRCPSMLQGSVKGLASRKECRLVSRRSCTVLYFLF